MASYWFQAEQNSFNHAARWLGIIALAAVLAAIGGNAAHASTCGHYVKRLGPGFVPGKTQVSTQQMTGHEAAPAEPSKAPCGCPGGQCGRAPEPIAPLSPGQPIRVQSTQEFAVAHSRIEHDPLDADSIFISDSLHLPRGFFLRIDRPPRA